MLFMGGGLLPAQTGADPEAGLTVDIGATFEYEGSGTMITEVEDGKSRRQEFVVMDMLTLDSVQTGSQFWSVTMMVSMETADNKGVAEQTGVVPVTMTMVTDEYGRVRNIDAGGMPGMNGSLFSVGSSSTGAGSGPGWFLPPDILTRKEGESWTEHTVDTGDGEVMGGLNMDMVTDVSTTYTYGGIVDTLGVKSARIHWRNDKLRMDGEMTMNGNAEMTITLNAEGTGGGTAYYSLEDRLMLVQRTEMTLQADVKAGMMGDQKVKMSRNSEQARVN